MKYLIDLFLLWKCLPDLLRHFKLMPQKTVMQDENGNPWPDPSGAAVSGIEPTYVPVKADQSELAVKGVGAAYAVYNLLNGGR